MENRQQPFNGGYAQHNQYNANINNLPLVPGQNSHGFGGAEYNQHNNSYPLLDGQIPENGVHHQQYDPNVEDIIPNSPPIPAENFHADASSVDMANIIDQIMGRASPQVYSYSDNNGFQADAYMNSANPSLFVQPETNTTFVNPSMENISQNGNYRTLTDNQSQNAPLYDVGQATASVINSTGQSASFSSNYYFPVNDMIQQPSMFASNSSSNWQGTVPGNLYGQYSSATQAATFNSQSQAYNFSQGASTAPIRPPQPSPGNQFMNVNPRTPGTSQLPMMSQYNNPNINSVMPGTSQHSQHTMSHFNALNTTHRMTENSLSGSVAFNPINTTTPMMAGTYSLPVSATNTMSTTSYVNPGARVTFGPGLSARIEHGYNAFTSNAPQSSPSGSSSSGISTVGNPRDRNYQIAGSSSGYAGRDILRQDAGAVIPSAVASSTQQGHSNNRVENYQQMLRDEPIFNRVYDPRYAELGLPVDPYLRMFNQHPEFWKNVHGNGESSKK